MASLMDFKGTRHLFNAGTGARLTKSGKALGTAVGGAGIAAKGVSNMLGTSMQKGRGITKAPMMGSDFRQSPTMGSSGQLALSLADMKQPPGEY